MKRNMGKNGRNACGWKRWRRLGAKLTHILPKILAQPRIGMRLCRRVDAQCMIGGPNDAVQQENK